MGLLLGTRLTLVGGKGGVGKTTVAAALAVGLAEGGEDCTVVSVDPAHSLGDALGLPLGPEPLPVPDLPSLRALEVDAEHERRRFLSGHRGHLLSLLERGTYLDADDAAGLLEQAVPGIDELAALFRLLDLLAGEARLIVDTAPSGHTLRLLELPELARDWLGALQAMEARSQAVSTALVGRFHADEASELLTRLDRDLDRLSILLRAPERTRFVLVTTRERAVVAETLRYQEALAARGIPIGGVVVNRSATPLDTVAAGPRMVSVPNLSRDPVGVRALADFARHLAAGGGVASRHSVPDAARRVRLLAQFAPPAHHLLYLVTGKGGVGKSTAAAALALRLRDTGRRVLLLSIDPAGSLGDVLDTSVTAEARELPGAPGLQVRQLDAAAAWREFRAGYQDEVERIFGGLLSGPAQPGSDRAVVERLVDLAPPGVDELAALMEVVDVTEVRRYDAVVLDTAPTGHFLRLVALPEAALAWTHEVMRLLLRYREVVAPGELAERLLGLARSLRTLSARLRSAEDTWLLAVALPEALSGPETVRLFGRLQQLGIHPGALLLNRLFGEGEEVVAVSRAVAALVAEARPAATLGGPRLDAGPRGLDALRAYGESWRWLELEPARNGEQLA